MPLKPRKTKTTQKYCNNKQTNIIQPLLKKKSHQLDLCVHYALSLTFLHTQSGHRRGWRREPRDRQQHRGSCCRWPHPRRHAAWTWGCSGSTCWCGGRNTPPTWGRTSRPVRPLRRVCRTRMACHAVTAAMHGWLKKSTTRLNSSLKEIGCLCPWALSRTKWRLSQLCSD